ncbi:MAG: CYTH domain-containing protein [Thiotrichaceae bacterium]
MSTETELKLSIAPEHIEKFLQYPLLQQLLATTKQLHNTYFDTEKFDLQKFKLVYAFVIFDGQRVQTLKTSGQSVGGLHQRREWESLVPVIPLNWIRYRRK